MSDTFEKLNSKFSILSSKINDQSKKFFQFILLNGQSLCRKGKMQYEIEKLKWELKQKYNILGQYVFDQKKMNSTTDFSHNEYFIIVFYNHTRS